MRTRLQFLISGLSNLDHLEPRPLLPIRRTTHQAAHDGDLLISPGENASALVDHAIWKALPNAFQIAFEGQTRPSRQLSLNNQDQLLM